MIISQLHAIRNTSDEFKQQSSIAPVSRTVSYTHQQLSIAQASRRVSYAHSQNMIYIHVQSDDFLKLVTVAI